VIFILLYHQQVTKKLQGKPGNLPVIGDLPVIRDLPVIGDLPVIMLYSFACTAGRKQV
jgi:hypothetical protein